MIFVKAFNDRTKKNRKKMPRYQLLLQHIKIDLLDFVTKATSLLVTILKKQQKIPKGNSTPGRSLEGKVTIKQIEEIAEQ